jgi:hypothetical protein
MKVLGTIRGAWRAYWLPCIWPPLNLKVLFPKFDFDWEAYDWQTF